MPLNMMNLKIPAGDPWHDSCAAALCPGLPSISAIDLAKAPIDQDIEIISKSPILV